MQRKWRWHYNTYWTGSYICPLEKNRHLSYMEWNECKNTFLLKYFNIWHFFFRLLLCSSQAFCIATFCDCMRAAYCESCQTPSNVYLPQSPFFQHSHPHQSSAVLQLSGNNLTEQLHKMWTSGSSTHGLRFEPMQYLCRGEGNKKYGCKHCGVNRSSRLV